EVGALVGTAAFQADAAAAHHDGPVLRTHDRWGHRVDEVDYSAGYHAVLAAAVGQGAHTGAWARPRPGAHVARAATFMLFAQVEPGHACPVSMTHAVVPALRATPAVPVCRRSRSGRPAAASARRPPEWPRRHTG